MKVLFIDDEPLIRQGLHVLIPWEKYGFTQFFDAEDGTEGIEIIEKENPDLVILDICMESVSGLALARRVRENCFTGRIIIVSGYSDFEYAKAAISSGVTAYLLKPVSREELSQAVEKAIEELQKENIISIFSEQPMRLSRHHILKNLITGTMSYSSEIARVYDIHFHYTYYRLLLLCSPDEGQHTADGIMQRVPAEYISISLSDTLSLFVLTEEKQYQHLLRCLEDFPELIAIASLPTADHTGIPALYQEIWNIYNNLYYYKEENRQFIQTNEFSERYRQAELRQADLITLTNDLIRHTQLLHDADIRDTTLLLQDHLMCRMPSRDSLGFMLVNCYTQIVQELLPHHPRLEFELPDRDQFMIHLYADRYLCDSIAFLRHQLTVATQFIRSTTQENPCDRLCRYIASHYAEPLKMETLAKMFGYNSAYLGKLFYRETGEYFNTYVDMVRIEHAKDCLAKGASINQTCELCGFSNTDYFTKKFKKYIGMLPSDYRKQNYHQEKG